MSETFYFTDTISASLSYAGDDDITTDDFDASELETVSLDSPWTEFFDTDQFVQFDATVAQPIVQPYFHDGSLRRFKKDEQELRQAQAQLDNLPWTMGHPDEGRVTNASQIRGFWSDPYYEDGQQATVNIPADDTEAIRFAVDNDEVSVGFSGTLDWIDHEAVDAIQRQMAYDHVASVQSGRCPPEKGCGLHTDDVDVKLRGHGHSFGDGVQTYNTEEYSKDAKFDEGDWVSFLDGSGERRYGKVVYIDDERTLVRTYDTATEALVNEPTMVGTSSLRDWDGPHVDSCEGLCHCGCHDPPFADEAPDGIHTEDGSWYGVAPSENNDNEAKYELSNCNDVKDAYNLRGSGDYDIDESTLVNRIERAAQAHDCPPEQKPWVDTAERLASFIAN